MPFKHGACKTPEYRTWRLMLARCYTESAAGYSEYGGRGIEVCRRWRNSFQNFLADMGHRPTIKHTIDRKDGNGNYEPGNCRWATQAEQARNRSNNVWITFEGETLCAADWEVRLGLPRGLISHRLADGWSSRAVLKPLRPHERMLTVGAVTKSITDWASTAGLTPETIHNRLRRKWAVERIIATPVRQYKPEILI